MHLLTSLSVTDNLTRLGATSKPSAHEVSPSRLGVTVLFPFACGPWCLTVFQSQRGMVGRHPSPSADGVRSTTGNSLLYTFRSRFRAHGVSEGPLTCAGVDYPRFTFRSTSNNLRWLSQRRGYTARVRDRVSLLLFEISSTGVHPNWNRQIEKRA